MALLLEEGSESGSNLVAVHGIPVLKASGEVNERPRPARSYWAGRPGQPGRAGRPRWPPRRPSTRPASVSAKGANGDPAPCDCAGDEPPHPFEHPSRLPLAPALSPEDAIDRIEAVPDGLLVTLLPRFVQDLGCDSVREVLLSDHPALVIVRIAVARTMTQLLGSRIGRGAQMRRNARSGTVGHERVFAMARPTAFDLGAAAR